MLKVWTILTCGSINRSSISFNVIYDKKKILKISDDITVLNMLYIIYIIYNIHMSLTRTQKQL